jgi:hypothetical protein
MAMYWVTYTATARRMQTPFLPNHPVPADRYVVDGDWLEFRETYKGTLRPVMRIRKDLVDRIERIEDWRAERRGELESAAYQAAIESDP